VRGTRHASSDGQAVHLLAALDQQAGAVLGQAAVVGKTNEITRFAPLLGPLELAGYVITADALHTQREHAEFLVAQKNAQYILVVKKNQPGLCAQIKNLPWRHIPVAARRLWRIKDRAGITVLELAELPVRRGVQPHCTSVLCCRDPLACPRQDLARRHIFSPGVQQPGVVLHHRRDFPARHLWDGLACHRLLLSGRRNLAVTDRVGVWPNRATSATRTLHAISSRLRLRTMSGSPR